MGPPPLRTSGYGVGMTDGHPRERGTQTGWRGRAWLRYLVIFCVSAPFYGLGAVVSHAWVHTPWESAVAMAVVLAVFVPVAVLWSTSRTRSGGGDR